MDTKEVRKGKLSRRDFLKVASASGFGTAIGSYLLSITGCEFLENYGDEEEPSIQGIGVQYRVREVGNEVGNGVDNELGYMEESAYSVCEILMSPGSETLIELNERSSISYEVQSGKGILARTATVPMEKGTNITLSIS